MSARENILARVRKACARDLSSAPNNEAMERAALLASLPSDVQRRINRPEPLTQPDVTEPLADTLIDRMEAVQMSVARLQSSKDIVQAVEWFLQENDLPALTCVAPALQHLPWASGTAFGPAEASHATGVSKAMTAIAETGSLVFQSGPESPATLNFLPENHVVVLYESHIVARLEDVWNQTREQDNIARALNLVTGPSRTGDIEQTIELGAHGPRRVHVLLISADASID